MNHLFGPSGFLVSFGSQDSVKREKETGNKLKVGRFTCSVVLLVSFVSVECMPFICAVHTFPFGENCVVHAHFCFS